MCFTAVYDCLNCKSIIGHSREDTVACLEFSLKSIRNGQPIDVFRCPKHTVRMCMITEDCEICRTPALQQQAEQGGERKRGRSEASLSPEEPATKRVAT